MWLWWYRPQLQLHLTPGPGTSICRRYGYKRKKIRKKLIKRLHGDLRDEVIQEGGLESGNLTSNRAAWWAKNPEDGGSKADVSGG